MAQACARLRGKDRPAPTFRTPLVYTLVRHPIHLGFLLALLAAPTMTTGHLLFAVATSGYILIGIYPEERDLVAHFGDQYLRYRRPVGMLLARPWRGAESLAPKGADLSSLPPSE